MLRRLVCSSLAEANTLRLRPSQICCWRRCFFASSGNSSSFDKRSRHNPDGWTMQRAQQSVVVRVPAVLSDEEIAAVFALATDLPSSHSYPNHDTCILSSAGAFAAALPELRQKLMDVARRVDAEQQWHLLEAVAAAGESSQNVTPRVVEMHTARPHTVPAALLDEDHYDMGSLITVDVMLSPHGSFEGGAFETLEEDGENQRHRFERGDALVFVSHKYHRVASIHAGVRQVLVMELWSGIERTCSHRCSTRDGRCRFHDETVLAAVFACGLAGCTYAALGLVLG